MLKRWSSRTLLEEYLLNGITFGCYYFSPDSSFNPNWTGWGQSWPCWLWPQITRKLIKYFIYLKNTYSCRNVFQIFMNLWHDIKNYIMMYFWHIFVKSPAAVPPCWPPPLFRSILLLLQTIRRQERSCQAMVHSPAQPQSGFYSVSSPWPCRVWGLWVVSRAALSLFLNRLLALYWSGKVPKIGSSISQWHIIHAPSFLDRALSI